VATIIVYILFLGPFSFYQKYQVKQRYERLQENYSELEEENERLKKENEALKNDEKVIEKKAREFGMQKAGEEIFIFQEEDGKSDKN
jgi:cell division protein FtsB